MSSPTWSQYWCRVPTCTQLHRGSSSATGQHYWKREPEERLASQPSSSASKFTPIWCSETGCSRRHPLLRRRDKIDKGDELLTTYRGISHDFMEDGAAIEKSYGFRCDCALCKAEELVFADMQAKRAQVCEQSKSWQPSCKQQGCLHQATSHSRSNLTSS